MRFSVLPRAVLHRKAWASIAGVAALASGAAHALPLAISYEYFGLNYADNSKSSNVIGALNYTGDPGCGGVCIATAALAGDPSETIDIDSVLYEGGGGGNTLAELGYYFVVPGAGPTAVYLHAGDSLQAPATGYAQAYIAVGQAGTLYTSLNNFLSYSYQDTDCANYCDEGVANDNAPKPLPADQVISVTRGQLYLVTEWVQVGGTTSGAQLHELADPTIMAGPGDTIEFSPGVTSAAPEPAAWALMVLGLGGLGARLRSRRWATAAA